MFVCVRRQVSVVAWSWYLYRSLFSPVVCVWQVCLSVWMCVCVFPYGDERSWVAQSTKLHQRRRFTTTTPLFCRSHPAPLVFVASLSLHSPTEARLLFKAALSFGLSTASLSLFPADVNRVASEIHASPEHTSFRKPQKKQKKREWKEAAQNKMGTTVAMLFLPSQHQENTFFKVSPQFN